MLLSFKDSFDSPDTNRSIDSRRDPFHRVVYRVDFYLSRHGQRQRNKKGKSRAVERSKKKEIEEKKRERERSVERALGRRNKFHFPARCTDFSPTSVERSTDFRSILQTRWSTDTENREPRHSSLAESRPWTLSRQRKRKRAGLPRSKRVRKRSKRRRFGIADEKGQGGSRRKSTERRRKERSPRNRGEPRCRGSGEGRGGGREGNGSSVDEEARCRIFPAGPR